ncbi:S-layer homology domain-containing protein [Crassaminicella profunda]|uniref:S-layer homology domain-containing protein n=1 Tax=Crassaminicella profunda TaxID=1286698 RepID=UPI001CA69257|nr:S-layer homology domain-containing protein [Crassaminicella profunda]QZY55326.1 S-layer homology domain-containing protein [Crassaminicella profunda]
MRKRILLILLSMVFVFGTVISYAGTTVDVDYNKLNNLLEEASNHPKREDYLMRLKEGIRSESGIDKLKEKVNTEFKDKLEKRGMSVSEATEALETLKSLDKETRIALIEAVSDNNSNKIKNLLGEEEQPATGGGGGVSQEEQKNQKIEEKKEDIKEEQITKEQPIEKNIPIKKECHFADIENHWAKDSIIHMVSIGITSGLDEYTFAPQESLTRSQMATFMVKLLDLKVINEESLPFKDMNKENWDYTFVKAAYDAKLVSGISKELFVPNAKITREQMMTMIMNALIYKDCMPKEDERKLDQQQKLDKVSDWAKDAIQKGINLGIIDSNNKIIVDPQGEATRAETIVMIEKVYKLINNQ